MSSLAPAEEIELLERVLLRLGNADSDEKLEAVVGKFLCPVLLKITSPHENVRCKVMEILNHVNKRLKSRSLVQLPLEPLFDQYKMSDSAFLHNFVIIYISMGFKRISLEKQGEMVPKVLSCLPGKPESHKENLILLVVPTLGDVKVPDDPKDRPGILQLDQQTRQMFIGFLQDILLFPYGVTEEAELPPGLCTYSFKRIVAKNWKAEELEQHKRGIVKFVCHGIFTDLESFILLVLASSDTRFSVATPAIAELSKVCTTLDFTDPQITAPLYTLFSGNGSKELDRKTTPCSARVRQKLLQYLIKNRGKGINTVKGIQVIFEGLYGDNTNQKCKVLALQFCENLIKDGPKELLSKVAKVLLSGLAKLIGKDSTEPLDVQNAAYSAMAQLARTCPDVVNEDLKILLSYFNHLSTASPELHSSIREALVAMAPAFAWNYNAMDTEGDTEEKFIMNARQNLLLAMLADSAQSKLQIAQNVTSVFLTTCFPEYFAPARFLLLLIAGERSSLREAIITYLYGVSKKDHINYNMLSSIDHPEEVVDESNKLSSEQRRVVLPSFKEMTNHTWEMIQKRLNGPATKIVVGKTELAYTLNVYEEILDYLRICLWFSAGVKAAPGDEKHSAKLRDYVLENYEDSENNEIYKYLQLVRTSVEARRDETNLLCLYDLLNAAPDLLTAKQMHLLEPLSLSIRDISEILRGRVAQVYGILLAYGLPDVEFDGKMDDTVNIITQTTNPVEMRAGWSLVLGHAYSRRIIHMQKTNMPFIPEKWMSFIPSVQVLAYLLVEQQTLLVTAAVKGLSLIGKVVEIPEFEIKFSKMEVKDVKIECKAPPFTRAPSKFFIYEALFSLLQTPSTRAKIREDAAICLGYLAIGDGEFFTLRNLHKFLSFAKVLKDPALNIAIAQAIVCTICGYDVNLGPPSEDFVNPHYVESNLEWFLQSLLKIVPDPNPQSRQACSIWLLAVVKHCSNLGPLIAKKQMLQYAFTELLSDDSEFVQDVASRGLGLVFTLSTPNSQQDLANSLIDQLIGGKRDVKKVNEDTEMFPEGYLGKTPTGGNITTYKELCGLASDLNQPEMIYQFLQLANNNAAWNSRVGAAFGLKSIPKDAKIKMQPFLGKIIPRFYRYKYDPTPRIQNSMISIWDSIVTDSKEAVETFYWEILKEILAHLTDYEWRVRIACCLAVRDLLKRPNGLRLRSEEKTKQEPGSSMDVDEEVPEPELKELWAQLFRVMDDTHDGTRTAAEGTANTLSKICVIAASSNHGKSGMAVASSILPLLLDVGITHTVPEVRKISIKTISELIESSGALIKPHLPSLIPCLLRATGELEIPKLYLAGGSEVQEAVDSLRAEAAKSHHTMETTAKCVRHIDFESLEQMTPAILDLMKSSISLGSKTACAHFICLVSIRLGKDMTPLVGKYLGACFNGLKDRNSTVRKYYASAIGHLIGIAKEQSIKNLLSKLDDYYQENPLNKGIPLTIQSINKRYHDLLKDYMENVLPLIFFAMHEEVNEENKSNVELWKELWIEISPGDAGIRMNLDVIIDKLEKNLEDPSWLRKAQSANAIHTIANRLGTNLEEEKRLKLLNLLLAAVGGRTFEGKEKILQAIASLCKGLDKEDPICESIIDAAMKECRKEEPKYRTHALRAIGDILEELEADRFEEVYDMIWYLLDKKDLQSIIQEDDATNITADERNKRAQIFNKLKEVVCETLGKSWPKNSFETQEKYQILFAERCAQCLKDNTRQVQVSLLVALGKFLERLKIFNVEDESNKEKKQKVDRDGAISKICSEVLSAVAYVSTLPHTGLRKESLNIILTLIKKLSEREHAKHLAVVKKSFEETLPGFEKDSSPEVRCRIKDIQDKLRKI